MITTIIVIIMTTITILTTRKMRMVTLSYFPQQLDLSSRKSFKINYLKTTPAQVDKLKGRSTSCLQDVTFSNCVGKTVSIGQCRLLGP